MKTTNAMTGRNKSLLGALVLLCALVFLLAACATKPKEKEPVWVSSVQDQVFWTETKETIHAAYYSLDDQSQSFVRLLLPDGNIITLPQVKVPTGTQYSDDFSYRWTPIGEHASLQKRDDEGRWVIKYGDCVRIKPSSP